MSERDKIEKAATEAVGPLSPQYDAWPRQYVIDFTLAELRKQAEAHKADLKGSIQTANIAEATCYEKDAERILEAGELRNKILGLHAELKDQADRMQREIWRLRDLGKQAEAELADLRTKLAEAQKQKP